MSSIEEKLKTSSFWLKLGAINHGIAILVLLLGCAVAEFTCRGEVMSKTLSVYTFTLFTPQVAVEMIILLALLLVSGGANTIKSSANSMLAFLLSLALLVIFLYSLL